MKHVIQEGVRFFDAAGLVLVELRVCREPEGAADCLFRDDRVIQLIGDRLREAGLPDVTGRHTLWFDDGAVLPEEDGRVVVEGARPHRWLRDVRRRDRLTRDEYFAAPLRPLCGPCWRATAGGLGAPRVPTTRATSEWEAQPVFVNDDGQTLIAPCAHGRAGATCARCGAVCS